MNEQLELKLNNWQENDKNDYLQAINVYNHPDVREYFKKQHLEREAAKLKATQEIMFKKQKELEIGRERETV